MITCNVEDDEEDTLPKDLGMTFPDSPTKPPEGTSFQRYSRYKPRPTFTEADITDDIDERDGDISKDFPIATNITRKIPTKLLNASKFNRTMVPTSSNKPKSSYKSSKTIVYDSLAPENLGPEAKEKNLKDYKGSEGSDEQYEEVVIETEVQNYYSNSDRKSS